MYDVKKKGSIGHKLVVDADTREMVCLCGEPKCDYGRKMSLRDCEVCGKSFVPKSYGGTRQFCSYKCANNRKRTPRSEIKTIVCVQCKKNFVTTGIVQRKLCSWKCVADKRNPHDGMTNPERARRKKGQLKMHTPEWLERIRARMKEVNSRPEIRAMRSKSRSPRSLEARIKQSNALAGKLPKNMWFGSNHFSNVQNGDYENSKGTMYFRSKWEANYALFLDFLVKQGEIKDWQYEADCFVFDEVKFGTRSYLPDYKIFNNDGSFEYHEVKGYMDSKSKTKLKRMAKYFPDVKLILIDSVYYNDLKKKVGKLLNFY